MKEKRKKRNGMIQRKKIESKKGKNRKRLERRKERKKEKEEMKERTKKERRIG